MQTKYSSEFLGLKRSVLFVHFSQRLSNASEDASLLQFRHDHALVD
jgi:hypothetical protein